MAAEFKHKRYFAIYSRSDWENNISESTWERKTFTGTAAQAHAEFTWHASCWSAGSPTVTYALEDSNTVLVVTYEFGSEADQNTFKTAVDARYADGTAITGPASDNQYFGHHKTEWLHSDGTVSATATDILPPCHGV